MTFMLDVALRASAPVVVALVACVLLRRRSAALRHSVLTAALAAAVTVVPLSFVVPSWTVTLPAAVVPAPPVAAVPGTAAESHGRERGPAPAVTPHPQPVPAGVSFDPLSILPLIWLAGVAIGAGLLLVGVVRLVRLTRRGEPVVNGPWHRLAPPIAARYGIRRSISMRTTGASDVLATWGLFNPRVLLPVQAHAWSDDRVHVALCHELAHIRRFDWPVQMTADVLRTVFWFNPLLWVLGAAIRRESEHACDDVVLGAGVPAGTYASHIVEIAKSCRRPASPWVPVMSVARPSTLEGRITAMLNSRLNRQAPTWGALAIILVSLIGIVLPTASFTVSAQGIGPGALTGYVYDPSGGALPGVEVTLTRDQQAQRSAVTDGTGRFVFPTAGAGTYVLQATLPGFRTLRNEFVLEAPRDWTRNITMQVGELEETIRVTAKRPAQAAPLPREADRANPIRIGGNIKQPRKLKDVPPVYPSAMQEAGLEGVVPMDAVIGVDGRVVSVRVLSAEVHPAFARAAEEAVRQWIFSPTLLNNVAVPVEMTVSVQFTLED